MQIDDIIFGISALSLGTVVAFTHGGTQPIFPHEAPPAMQIQEAIEPLSQAIPAASSQEIAPVRSAESSSIPGATTLSPVSVSETDDHPIRESEDRDSEREEDD